MSSKPGPGEVSLRAIVNKKVRRLINVEAATTGRTQLAVLREYLNTAVGYIEREDRIETLAAIMAGEPDNGEVRNDTR